MPELVGGEILQSISKVLPGKWPVLASLSSILLQVVSGTTTITAVIKPLSAKNVFYAALTPLDCHIKVMTVISTCFICFCAAVVLGSLGMNKDQWELDSTFEIISFLPSLPLVGPHLSLWLTFFKEGMWPLHCSAPRRHFMWWICFWKACNQPISN